VDYEICITHLGTFGTNVKNMIFKTETIKIELGIVEGGNVTPVNSVLKPLKVLSEYDDTDRYTQGKTSGFLYDSEIGKWKRLNTAYDSIMTEIQEPWLLKPLNWRHCGGGTG